MDISYLLERVKDHSMLDGDKTMLCATTYKCHIILRCCVMKGTRIYIV